MDKQETNFDLHSIYNLHTYQVQKNKETQTVSGYRKLCLNATM